MSAVRSGRPARATAGKTVVKAEDRGTRDSADAASDDTGRVGGGGREGGGDSGGGPGRGSAMVAAVGGGGDTGGRGRGSSVMAGASTAAAGQ